MADTLKQFGNDTEITYTELQDGQSLVSTSGSQKAVVKDIAIDNPSARTINITVDSKTGTKVASTKSKSDTLSGNLILDNSQSLHISSPDNCAVTDFRTRGWGEADTRSQNELYIIGSVGTEYNPNFRWDGQFGSPDINDSSTSNFKHRHVGVNIQNPSNGFEANGYWYWHHLRNSGTYTKATMCRTDIVDGSTGAGGTVTQYGSEKAYVMAYDGSRYIYTLEESGNTMRKYDTNTLGTSDTYTTINLLADNSSSAQTITFTNNGYTAGSYFRDGYLFVNANGETSTASESKPRIIDVATGKTKLIYDPGYDDSGDFASVAQSYFRRSMGIAKDSSGTYWAFLGQIKYYASNDSMNRVWGCSLGKNIGTDFIANGKTFGDTFNYRLYDWSSDSTERTRIRQPMCCSGYLFGNSCGAIMYTPGLDRYLYTYQRNYSQSNSGGAGLDTSTKPMLKFDFDNVLKGITSFISMPTRVAPGESYSMMGWVDPDKAASGFGNVKARTTGILVT